MAAWVCWRYRGTQRFRKRNESRGRILLEAQSEFPFNIHSEYHFKRVRIRRRR
jgi:hypothetical protein